MASCKAGEPMTEPFWRNLDNALDRGILLLQTRGPLSDVRGPRRARSSR